MEVDNTRDRLDVEKSGLESFRCYTSEEEQKNLVYSSFTSTTRRRRRRRRLKSYLLVIRNRSHAHQLQWHRCGTWFWCWMWFWNWVGFWRHASAHVGSRYRGRLWSGIGPWVGLWYCLWQSLSDFEGQVSGH
ncbi:hypothetical protein AAC387_Pa01g4304 [Persea americana]